MQGSPGLLFLCGYVGLGLFPADKAVLLHSIAFVAVVSAHVLPHSLGQVHRVRIGAFCLDSQRMPSDGFPFAVQVVHHAVSVVSLLLTAAGRHRLCLMHPSLQAASASNSLIQSWCSIQLQAASPWEPTAAAFGVTCHTTTTNGTGHAAVTLQSTHWHVTQCRTASKTSINN
jgi:hypothetical protein